MRLWNTDGSGEPVVLGGPAGEVYSVAFSPDCNKLSSGSSDQTVRLGAIEIDSLLSKLWAATSECVSAPQRRSLLQSPPERPEMAKQPAAVRSKSAVVSNRGTSL